MIKIAKNQRQIKIENGIEAKVSINPFTMKDLQQITYKNVDWAKTAPDKRPKDSRNFTLTFHFKVSLKPLICL